MEPLSLSDTAHAQPPHPEDVTAIAVRPGDRPSLVDMAAAIERAAQLMGSDPRRGRELATRCISLAEEADAPELAARARYLCARAHWVNGEHDLAVQLIGEARAGYLAAGAQLEALRTSLGLMNVLRDQGRYQEALAVGQAALAEAQAPDTRGDPEEILSLEALMHQNAGLCYEQMGAYDQAMQGYAVAETLYRNLGMTEQVGAVVTNRGIVLLALGRISDALASFEQSAAIFAAAGLTLLHAETLINIGGAQLLLGQFARSLEAFALARRLFEATEAQADMHVLTLDTGDAYMALNRYEEALAAYREASAGMRDVGMAHDQARALWGAGTALLALHQHDAAAQALDSAAELFRAGGNQPMLSGVLLERADLLARSGQVAAARALAAQARDLVADEGWPIQQFYAHLRLADLAGPDLDAAEGHLLTAQRIAEPIGLPHMLFRLQQRLGRLRLRQGRGTEAGALLRAAIAQIEQLRGTLVTESLRVSFLQDKVAVYDDLLRLALDDLPGGRWEAFVIAERAKARALVDLLASADDRAPSRSGDPVELGALQGDLHAVYSDLLGQGAAPRLPARLAELRARASQLEQQISLLHLRQAAHAPPDPLAAPLTAAELRVRLDAVDGLLAYHILGDEILAFVLVSGDLRVVRGVSQVSTIEPLVARMAAQWDRLSAGPEFVARHMAVLDRSARQVLGELHRQLIAPIAGLLAAIPGGPRRLVVVPHGILHQIPFHALCGEGRMLIEDFEITYAPSTTALTMDQPAAPRGGGALVVGVSDPLIPMVAEEIMAVARHLGGAEVLADGRATLRAVRELAPGRSVLHMACHGLFRGDNPLFSALRLGDGWLTAAEIARLDLRGALVALSACESGRGRVYDGDEVVGLTRAFLAAGARTLLVSHWLVQDEAAAALMERWYAEMGAGRSPAAALRSAQLAICARMPHPYYWAPFFLVGRI